MKAFILAAGLGTRLKPWTLEHPKALVPVGGTPMLERVIARLRSAGFDRIVVNVHHFASQIVDFLAAKDFGIDIEISDESGKLMDTGGGVVHARDFLCADDEPFLVHNVDIVSDADIRGLWERHSTSGADATLLVSDRDSSRKLIVADGRLRGWRNLKSGEIKPADFSLSLQDKELAFSGIHCISPGMVEDMAKRYGNEPFPIMEYYLSSLGERDIRCDSQDFRLIDIGKPETLRQAQELF